MIYDLQKNAGLYTSCHPTLAAALQWLTATDLTQLADDRIAIDGDDIYAVTPAYETSADPDRPYEAHQRYGDIQVLASGAESADLLWTPDLNVRQAYDPDKDCVLFDPPADTTAGVSVPLVPGRFAVFFPDDIHRPGMALGAPQHVRKVVVKFRVAQ